MAETGKRRTKTATVSSGSRSKASRRAPRERVIEAGRGEQGGERMARRKATAGDQGKAVAGRKEREESRYGGIPLGSDPRE